MDNKVFISYKRNNKKIVLPIVDEIQRQLGFKCWIDLEGIEDGALFENVRLATTSLAIGLAFL